MTSCLLYFGIEVLYPKRNVVQAGAHLTQGARVARLSFYGLDKLDSQPSDPAERDTDHQLFHRLSVHNNAVGGAFLVNGPWTDPQKASPTVSKGLNVPYGKANVRKGHDGQAGVFAALHSFSFSVSGQELVHFRQEPDGTTGWSHGGECTHRLRRA
jgi:hypothetical protein